MILLKLYFKKPEPTNTKDGRLIPVERILVDETPDEMKARAQTQFKKITDKYPTITDPKFFKIENYVSIPGKINLTRLIFPTRLIKHRKRHFK